MGLKRQDVDRLLSPEFVEGLADAPVGELRSKRAECRRVEDLMSYLRRVVQGQIDLVVAEMELRLGGGVSDHQRRLVEDLPSILAGSHTPAARAGSSGPGSSDPGGGGPRPGGPGGVDPRARGPREGELGAFRQATALLAMPAMTEVFAEDVGLDADEIAEVISPELAASTFKGGMLPGANLGSFADAELTELVERLSGHESVLSAERRVLHERIDLLQAIVVERYKSGAARADTLLEDSVGTGNLASAPEVDSP